MRTTRIHTERGVYLVRDETVGSGIVSNKARKAVGCLFSRAQKHVEGQEYQTVKEYEQTILKALDRKDELEESAVEAGQMIAQEISNKNHDLTTAQADVKRLLKIFYLNFDCPPGNDELNHDCPNEQRCNNCWHKWLQERP